MSVVASGVAGQAVRLRPAPRPAIHPARRPAGVPAGRRAAGRAEACGNGTSSPGLRLTRRGRLVVAGLASVVGLFGTFASERAVAGQGAAAIPVTTRTVTVGETLWDVARSYTGPGEDIRDVVDDLIDLNGLAGGGLRAGQELLVPAP